MPSPVPNGTTTRFGSASSSAPSRPPVRRRRSPWATASAPTAAPPAMTAHAVNRPMTPRSDGPAPRNAENLEVVVHETYDNPETFGRIDSAGAERQHQLAAGRFIETIEIEGRIAFIAEELDQRRAPLFERRLELAIGDAQQLHLQRL